MIGYALCGSYCTHRKSLAALEKLVSDGLDVLPVVSDNVSVTDTRFGSHTELLSRLESITGRVPLKTVTETELLGPKTPLECLIIAPCTGNTLAKIANGITDTSVTMAAKAHLRADRPLLIALATNDAMSANLKNIGELLLRKQVYFVPMKQDDPERKPHSLVCDFDLLPDALTALKENRQLRPLFL